ncbi:MAG: Re/Si-specific NAD(P)(+) transhydrogenase subunit alpha [FCB group bacterium]|nr:Re/Si-specific NAD(P)(+) transhydrogenase subunit alpha [FCB group bacterium]
MIVAIPKEITPGERRVAAIPATVKEMVKKGLTVHVQAGAGAGAFISDEEYQAAGASIIDNVEELYRDADLILKVDSPRENPALGKHEADLFKEGSAYISFFKTTMEVEAVRKFVKNKITGFSMNLLPRITLAQKMDALSSQSNIAGYKAVLIGAVHLGKYMPLLMTAAGTIPPAKVLILGAGVAGLQAIATAKRLGAQVEAFDVRPEVKEQVESLGARFVEVPANEEEVVVEGGYAKETTESYQKRQRALIKEHIAKSDLVITTALIPGKRAPILIPADMVEGMSPGSVIIDLAAENGGNCELTEPGKICTKHKVTIDGRLNLPSTMPIHASQLYAKNIVSLVLHLCPEGEINLNMDDEIIAGAMFTHNGEIVDERTRQALNN